MVTEHIENIISGLKVKGEVQLVETHISWVILTEKLVYKIKKPVKFSFLDFSTLEKRHYYCKREVDLNRRLTTDMYLDVVPICWSKDRMELDTKEGKLMDYAVKMKRMDESRQMNLLLEKNLVTKNHMDKIAGILSSFHRSTDKFKYDVDIAVLHNDFADILPSNADSTPVCAIEELLVKVLGTSGVNLLRESIAFSETFLKEHQSRIQERNNAGFTVDGHGDLHSRNIFLLDDPVIFDCIEFNDHFRRLDLLDELAFFCMDLELYGRSDLANDFMLSYENHHPCILNEEDQKLYQYYKLYRANIKIKVNALKGIQLEEAGQANIRIDLLQSYFQLFKVYYEILQSSGRQV